MATYALLVGLLVGPASLAMGLAVTKGLMLAAGSAVTAGWIALLIGATRTGEA